MENKPSNTSAEPVLWLGPSDVSTQAQAAKEENAQAEGPQADSPPYAPVQPEPPQEEQPEAEDNDLCKRCKQRERDRSENPGSVLCTTCQDQLIRLKIPGKIKWFLAALCLVFALSFVPLPRVLSTYKVYVQADRQYQRREYAYALSNYQAVLNQYPSSVKVILKTIDAAMGAQDFVAAADTFDEYLIGKDLSDAQFMAATRTQQTLQSYFDAVNKIVGDEETAEGPVMAEEEPGEAQDSPQEPVDGDDMAQKIRANCQALLQNQYANKTVAYYYLAMVTEDLNEQKEYLDLSIQVDPSMTFPISYYGTVLRRLGDFQEAREAYEMGLSRNACDALCMRGLAVLDLLEGNKEEALQQMREAYAIDPMDYSMPSTMVILLRENGLMEEAQQVLDQAVANGYEVEEDLRQYLNGETNARDYYVEREASL